MHPPYLVDVHTHLQFAAYLHDYEAVIKNALDRHIWMVNVGTQYGTSCDALFLAERHAAGVYAAVGLHPSHTGASHLDPQELKDLEKARVFTEVGETFDYAAYKKLAEHPKAVAIGECGLDYFRMREESKTKQQEVFEQHIALSHEVGKPLMIHCRNAFDDLIEILKAKSYHLKDDAGVIHFFSGTVENAKKLLDLGFSFSFGGVITFTRDYDEQAKYIPLDRILIETDAPYVAPVPHRGKRNEPIYVVETAKKLTEIKNISLEEIAQKTTANAKHIFNLPLSSHLMRDSLS
ncbi:MAG: TatD family hydrolase [Candidatus Sungbacteria bacterium]|nr:TatD family hydrolase [Candidatus Sungbacteria bacterium]